MSAILPDRPLTLADLASIALENHPSTRQAWWNAQRAAAALGSARSVSYPKLDFTAYGANGREFKFLKGPDVTYTQVGADLALSLLIYDGGVNAADVQAACQALSAAGWEADWNIQKVLLKVLENGYAFLHAQEVLAAARLSTQDAEKMQHYAKELNKAGLSPVSDLYSSQATLSQMKLDLAEKTSQFDIARAKLAASLGLPSETVLTLAPLAPLPEQTRALLALAQCQRADLLAKQARLAESNALYVKAQADRRPTITFAGIGGMNHAIHDKAKGAQYRISLNLSYPLFDGFETMYQNRLAYANTQLSLEELAELQLDISLEVLSASRSLEAAQVMLPEAEINLQNALKAYEGSLETYQAGKEGIAVLSYAQRQLAEARVRFSEVKTKWLVALVRLAYATGTLSPYLEVPCE
ncbi:MAG: TolC family protein [Parachlamydia sp.]|nr:TolC family protein [Parachlamydia sp.]